MYLSFSSVMVLYQSIKVEDLVAVAQTCSRRGKSPAPGP